MKKLLFLTFVVLAVISSCKQEEVGLLDVYSQSAMDAITVDFTVTPNPKTVTSAGRKYDLSTWKVKAVVKNATDGRFSTSMSFPKGASKSGSGLEQEIFYSKKGTYTVSVTVNTSGGVKTFDRIITQNFDAGLPMSDEEQAYALRVLAGKTFVLDVAAKGHLANTWWEADPSGKASSKCYDDEFTFKSDFTFTCSTNGYIYGNPDAKASLSKFPALSFDSDESIYDIFIKVDEAKRAQYSYEVRKMSDNPADPKSPMSYYIIFSSDEASLGYFDEMASNGTRRYKIINDDGDDNNFTSQVWAYNGDGSPNYFRQTKLVVKGYVPPVSKKPDGIYNVKETFDGAFKLDYNWTKNEKLIYDVAGKTYLYDPTTWQVAIVDDPTNASNKVVKVNRPAEEKWGFLYSPTLPMPLKAENGLTVSVKVYVPSTNNYVFLAGSKEGWAWNPTGQPESEFINFRIRLENPGLKGDAYKTRIEKDINLSKYKDQWVTVVFHLTKQLQERASGATPELNYKSVGFMFAREGYAHTKALDIYYDDIIITTPGQFDASPVVQTKSLKNIVHVY